MVTAFRLARTDAATAAFLRFYAGQTLSYAGDGLRTLAIPLLVFQLTGSAVALGWGFALEFIPYAFVSLLGGSLADRVNRRELMIVCDASRFVIIALLAALYWKHWLTLWEVYTALFLLSSFGAIFLGAQSSSVPYLLGKDRAKGGVAALSAAENAMNLIAPPVGGALFALAGALPALAVNAATYLLSQVSIASVRDFGPEKPSGLPNLREIADDVRTGWRWLLGDPAMRTITLSQISINLFGFLGMVAIIPYFKREFGFDSREIGFAFGAFSVGAIIGSITAGRTHWPFGRAMIIAYYLDALVWLPTIWVRDGRLAVLCIALASMFGTYRVATGISWRMRIIPEALVGRVFGVARMCILVASLPGALIGGWISDTYGTRMTMGVSGIGFLVLAGLLALSPAIRRDRR